MMEDTNLILCTRCGVKKQEKDFYFDKRRGKVRRPCRSCSNSSTSLKYALDYANAIIRKHDVVNHYKAKGFPDEIISVFSDLILLNREIKNTLKPMVKSHENINYLFCPTCGDVKLINLPCELETFEKAVINFKNLHRHVQRTRR